MYKIRGADQKEYGPVSAEVVRQWIAQRRANGQTVAQSEGSIDWKPLSDFPEFSEALATGVLPPPIGAVPAVPRPLAGGGEAPPKTSGLAIASLVLGLLGLFSCGITSLVGLVLGIVAAVKIKKSNGQLTGTGLAVAGICVSVFIIIVGLGIGAAALSRNMANATKPKTQVQSGSCVSNLKQIGLAARMWSNDNKDTFPPDFLSMSNELASPKILICPNDHGRKPAQSWLQFDPKKNVTYEYLAPGIKEDASMAKTVIFRCPLHGTVCYGDGSVDGGARGGRPSRTQ